MRLSRDKVNVLARAVSDVLKQMDEVEFIEDPNTIRQETRKILEELLNQEARIDVAARQKIESQKRTILEGSQEWDILYRKYYNEEVKEARRLTRDYSPTELKPGLLSRFQLDRCEVTHRASWTLVFGNHELERS